MSRRHHKMNFAGILAGGIGSRMERSVPKQFLGIADIPIVVRTLRTFFSVPCVDRIVLAMNPQWTDYCRNLLRKHGIDLARVDMIQGGATRFLSMANIVDRCIELAGDDLAEGDLLCIHDCARPFVSQRIIADNFAMVADYDMVTTSLPTIDTVIIAEDGKTETSVPVRSTVFCDQGPQTFRLKEFKRLQAALSPEETSALIEAGKMYLSAGKSVGIVPGDRMNFKITTEFDLTLAECLLRDGVKA